MRQKRSENQHILARFIPHSRTAISREPYSMSKTTKTSRRSALAFIGATFLGTVINLSTPLASIAAASGAQDIANHFSRVKSMTGEFVQFGPNGEQTGGKFFLERPGKIRFNYEKPSPVRVVADGKTVLINNRKLDTWQLYPLSKTPLKLLLDNQIDLEGKTVESVKEEADLTTVVMTDKNVFGRSKITMMFDPKTYDLRQWTITDKQGKDTTVMIYNVQEGVKFHKSVFNIDYRAINEKKNKSDR